MATISIVQQASLQISVLKAEIETKKTSQQGFILPLRQRRGEPAPLAPDSVLQMQLNKAYRTYQKIIYDIINTSQQIEVLLERQIAWLDSMVVHMSRTKRGVDLSEVLESFGAQIRALETRVLQQQRDLQAEQAAMIILANTEGRI
ncbi:MAG: hypothetical protein JSS10_07595 [Verrucomicrobia bacterium]|nr:hypothetical protein [Verrucomicrobiota bacterium]